MIETLPELMEYLEMRGDKYGITASELLEAIPEDARKPQVAYEFMQQKDISHKIALSEGGNPAGDNWILEDSSVNRARGSDEMTGFEEAEAHRDNILDARQLTKAAAVGGSLAAGGAIVDGAIAVGAGAASAAEATFITTVVVPAVVTTAIVGGAAYGCYRLIKWLGS